MCKTEDFIPYTIVITNRHLVKGDYLEQIRKVVRFHPHALIFREKDLTREQYEKLAEKVWEICEEEKVPCFVNADVLTAEKLGCRNIHISVAMITEVEKHRQNFDRISVSCHSLEDVRNAIDHGATQIILGTIFETECKRGLKGRGLSFVREICDYCKKHGEIPVYAIGGIKPENIHNVMAEGAKGGCMMSYLMEI